jgi:ribosomal protein S12 methylthiotransferase accessory factor
MYLSQAIQTCLEKSSVLIHPRTGVIRSVIEMPQFPGEPLFFQYTAVLTDINKIGNCSYFSRVAGGTSIYREEAMIKAIGEAIERYCAFIWEEDRLVRDTARNLSGKAIDLELLPMCSDKEYSNPNNYLKRPHPDMELAWCEAYSLVKKNWVLVPASYIYLASLDREDSLITLPVSTGLACGVNLEEAILSGIYEVVERDALMITWLNRLPRAKIDIHSIHHAGIQERIQRLQEANLEPYFFDITTDIKITSVLLVLVARNSTIPVLTVTAATHADPARALEKVIDEGVATRKYCVSLFKGGIPKEIDFQDFSKITTFEDHLLLYAYPEMAQHLDFLLGSKAVIKFRELQARYQLNHSLKDVKALFSIKGMDVLVSDLTTSDIEEAGFKVVRVLIPGLQPLSQNHNIRYLANRRIYEMPKLLGYDSRVRDEAEINPLPHPFA